LIDCEEGSKDRINVVFDINKGRMIFMPALWKPGEREHSLKNYGEDYVKLVEDDFYSKVGKSIDQQKAEQEQLARTRYGNAYDDMVRMNNNEICEGIATEKRVADAIKENQAAIEKARRKRWEE
jgi:ABC-type phosphate transport system auxiliary subunit